MYIKSIAGPKKGLVQDLPYYPISMREKLLKGEVMPTEEMNRRDANDWLVSANYHRPSRFNSAREWVAFI